MNSESLAPAPRPLRGTLVLDASRMLPGAVLARLLLELGARVIKVESPGIGDPLRLAPPLVDGIGAAFRAYYAGAESIGLDLRQPADAAVMRKLAAEADVLVESFRPGTLEGWGLAPAALLADHPALVVCSLSSFGQRATDAGRVAHDLNLVASSGLLALLGCAGVPRVQIADVSTGMLACSAILATLLGRRASGRGGWIDQPLATGPLPFLTLATAEAAAAGDPDEGLSATLLGGKSPAYRLYVCADGGRLAVAALEPKFWAQFVEAIGLPELIDAGLDCGAAGAAAAQRVQQRMAERTLDAWWERLRDRDLPVSPVAEDARVLSSASSAPLLPSLGPGPARGAPQVDENAAAIRIEFGL